MTARPGPVPAPPAPPDLPGSGPSRAGSRVQSEAASGRTRHPSGRRTPPPVVELLRLFVVIFFAGAGYQVGSVVDPSRPVLGALNGTVLGLVLGSGLGYVIGGVLGRRTAVSADRTRTRLHAVSADTIVAGAVGTMGGVLLGAGTAWPVFFLPEAYLSFPLFGFAVVLLGYLGYEVGASKREAVLQLFGHRAGVPPRGVPAVALPRVVDTSVAVDGRVLDVVRAGFLHGELLVPTAVLRELQALADSADDLRRAKGRRGLELLEALQREPAVDVSVLEVEVEGVADVDAQLVRICLDRSTALLTLDTGLARVARVAGVPVLDLHALTLALRAPVVAGEELTVLLVRPGKEPEQAVGSLDDGTMVVVERARSWIGQEQAVRATSVLTTANGRMVFAVRVDEVPARAVAAPRPVPRPRDGRPSPAVVPPRRLP